MSIKKYTKRIKLCLTIYVAYVKVYTANTTSEVNTMSEEQKKQAEKLTTEMNKLTPEMREKALIFMQGMAAMVQTVKQDEQKEA